MRLFTNNPLRAASARTKDRAAGNGAAVLELLEAGPRSHCETRARGRAARGTHRDPRERPRRLLVLRPVRRRSGGTTRGLDRCDARPGRLLRRAGPDPAPAED